MSTVLSTCESSSVELESRSSPTIQSTGAGKRYSRSNTLEEKRKMRRERKKRRKSRIKAVEAHLSPIRTEAEKSVVLYRNMSRSYWERWRWELQQRKESISRERALHRTRSSVTREVYVHVHEIDQGLLHDPPESTEMYVGRGSFGIVKMQLYRNVKVAVKELLPHSLLDDLNKEANILARFSHPYLPFLFGVLTTTKPLRIVMQFHGFGTTSMTLTDALSTMIEQLKETVLTLCAQLMEAMRYLHDEVNVLHNDLKCNNILIGESFTEAPLTDSSSQRYMQLVVIDFGKATTVEQGKRYYLSESEKADYIRRYSHIAPEVVEGLTRQSKMSDMYAVGGILIRILESKILRGNVHVRKAIDDFSVKCRSARYLFRPTAQNGIDDICKI